MIEVEDSNQDVLLPKVIGRKIMAIERKKDSGKDWQDGENSVQITFEDGSRLYFSSIGYDYSACLTYLKMAEGAK